MIESRADLAHYLAADLRAHGLDRWRFRDRFLHRPAYFQRVLRKAEYWTNTARTPLGRAVALAYKARHRLIGERFCFYIPLNVFGPGLSIAHWGPMWVHPQSRIGANCRIHQGVTLGEARGRAPILGDDVYLYPNAVVLGVDIGNRVGVRAGAVVTKAVPDDTEVGGVPARIIRLESPPTAMS
ncbi:serine acetyltransferase [Mycobacterium sp. M1]|uniref:Serine acetyltransferase n=1 Tax=Mycolicibacter acidiphilus TaxID=2835306 RepID=A0ABS5RGR6_9MYCO|nr:serine acetyltransferase [Mycolicibacter acidiphilus]MBS9533488.1 serine acetyltransferase [Mycolicibacter acidiphilus]